MYSTVYLIISEICILMCLSAGYLLCMACCLFFYVVAWILSYACGVHASNIVEKSFVFELEIKELSLGTATCLAYWWLGVL
jgi:hypothetical protein